MRGLLLASLLTAAPALAADDPARVVWWKQFPEDRLEQADGRMEWFPADKDHEIHCHFPALALPPAAGSKIRCAGALTFSGATKNPAQPDMVRLGLFEIPQPTPRDGQRLASPGVGVSLKINPFLPPAKPGAVIKLRWETDPPAHAFVLGSLKWKDKDALQPGFGCVPGKAYPFVLEIERVQPGIAVHRFTLNGKSVERQVEGMEFQPNTFAFGIPGHTEWKSLLLEKLEIRVVAPGAK